MDLSVSCRVTCLLRVGCVAAIIMLVPLHDLIDICLIDMYDSLTLLLLFLLLIMSS